MKKMAKKMTKETCHLILMYRYYDLIDKGFKRIEYRDLTPYWLKRIRGKQYVTFHRGYTNKTMTFKIDKLVFSNIIKIHLGERVKEA